VDAVAAAIEATGIASLLRQGRWSYPAVNAAHLFGVALVIGAAVPMDLRLIGVWRRETAVAEVVRLLRPVAASGAGLAVVTGALLFSVQATDYVALPLFWAKLALVALALGNALLAGRIAARPPAAQAAAGAVSLAAWPAVLVCGRLLGYL
jgi:hypothetical protein